VYFSFVFLLLDLDRLQPEPLQQQLRRLPQGADGIDARLRPQADDEGRTLLAGQCSQ
jgi:hypothetical protein